MTLRDRLALVAGVVLGLTGLAITLIPGLSPDIRVVSAIVAAVAVVALGLAVFLGVARLREDRERIAFPTPEGRSNAVPGDAINRRIARLSLPDPRADDPSAHAAFRARVERAARWVLAGDGSDAERAREQLDDGTWTDDPHAAALFADAGRLSVRERVRTFRTAEPPIVRRGRHAIAALAGRFHEHSSPYRSREDDSESSADVPSESSADASSNAGVGGIDDTTAGGLEFPTPGEMVERRTGRWRGASVVALAVGASGIVLRRPALLLASVVGVGLAAYARAATPPPIALDIERRVSNATPAVGDEVEVSITVRNVGESLCPDCAVIDGVPPGLVVTDGSPRRGVSLRPGNATHFSYTLTAVHGEHRFTPASVIARTASGSAERLARVPASGTTTISCIPPLERLDGLALRGQAMRFGGRMPTDAAGDGVEFHATREYRRGDPPARIDWNRLAKTGDLAAREFRAERMPRIVVVIDARRNAFLAPTPDDRSAVVQSVEAAGRIVATLLDDSIPAGVGALSPSPERCWLAPDTGDIHRERVRQLLATHPALAAPSGGSRTSTAPSDPNADLRATNPNTDPSNVGEAGDEDRESAAWLRRRLPADAQVIVLSPLCDDEIADWVRRLDAAGHATTVLSPDPTALTSPGRQLARIERAIRLADLRSAGVPVVDWPRTDDESLAAAMARLRARGEPSTTQRANPGVSR